MSGGRDQPPVGGHRGDGQARDGVDLVRLVSLVGWVCSSSAQKEAKKAAATLTVSSLDTLEQAGATGRYLSLAECGGWTELDTLMNELYPAMPLSAPIPEPVESRFGKPIADPIVTRFDLSRMQSLGVPPRSVRQILQESLEFFRVRGELT